MIQAEEYRAPIVVTKKQAWVFEKIRSSDCWKARALAREIALAVSERHGIPYADVIGPSRRHHIVAARFDAMAEIYTALPHWTLARIGLFFGGQHHTNVLYAVRKRGVWRA